MEIVEINFNPISSGKDKIMIVKVQNVDTELLEKYILRSGYKIGFITDQLGISRQAFDQKMKNKNKFRASEVYVLCDLLKITPEDKPKIFMY